MSLMGCRLSQCGLLSWFELQMPELRNWWNIRLAGKTKSIPENNTMWNVLTTASATPILELDFLGSDAHEMLGFSDQAKFAALQSGTTRLLTLSSFLGHVLDSFRVDAHELLGFYHHATLLSCANV